MKDNEYENDITSGIPKSMDCPICGKDAKVNIFVDNDTIIDYYYECECGNIIEGTL